MSGLAALLAGRTEPGVYRWHAAFTPAEIAGSVAAAGWRLASLDDVAETRAEALAGIGRSLGFPEHYGRNLDALWDCLRDLDAPTLLVWDTWGILAQADRPGLDRILRVLDERAAQGGFAVALRGEGPDDLDVPSLD